MRLYLIFIGLVLSISSYDTRGDRFASMLLDKITNNTIEYSVYQSGKQQVVVYDAKKIYPAIPANMYINSIY